VYLGGVKEQSVGLKSSPGDKKKKGRGEEKRERGKGKQRKKWNILRH